MRVRIVAYVSECDVVPVPDVEPMSYEQAVAELAEINRVAPERLAEFDIVSVNADGTLGRFVSWAV